jgi:hypothetical protein
MNGMCIACGGTGKKRCPDCGGSSRGLLHARNCVTCWNSGEAKCAFCSGTGKAINGCFIATAVYGDENHPKVKTLRNFRDQHLLSNKLGRLFVAFYYIVGPFLSKFVQHFPIIKRLCRFILDLITAEKEQ